MGIVFNPFTGKLDYTGASAPVAEAWTFGSAVINFGAFPGASEASVVVTGQDDIKSTAHVQAHMGITASSDHTVNDHAYAAALVGLTVGSVVDSTGFTITARCLDKMQGTFNVTWGWINV